MKEILGVFAAIAAVAGIASAVSKDEEKTLTERQKLELEQERLKLEASQNAHQQQMEQQRIQMARAEQEYQRKLANAPKKAIYKPVSSMQCPRCVGNRVIDQAAGVIRCPFCEYVEQLTVERYEIDQEAFQRQLQAEEQTRLAQAAEKQRKQNYDTAITTFAIITGVTVIILLNSPLIGALLFIPSLVILCFLVHSR